MDYTICKNVIDISKNGNKYTTLLFHFTNINNSDKVVLNNYILDSYKQFDTEMIRSWINLMTNLNTWKYIENITCNIDNVFIDSCSITYDKKLIVSEKEDYPNSKYNNLEVFNKDEALCNLTQTSQININGSNHNITTGNNSNINNRENQL